MTFRLCPSEYQIHSWKDQINSKHRSMKSNLFSHLLSFVVTVNCQFASFSLLHFSALFFLGDSSQYCLFEKCVTQLLWIVAKENGRDFPIDQRARSLLLVFSLHLAFSLRLVCSNYLRFLLTSALAFDIVGIVQ